ncbi:invasion associated locus B family protein [Azospirillum doebereinerae]|nr:invasion associated locus B family protein [Azospirillum doebereinerae]MCG5243646.1 invasion associated locus B family protein [Azospirillum doebereinerae]
MNVWKAALLCLALAAVGTEPALAADPPAKPDGAAQPLWSKRCVKENDREVCFIEQYAVAMPANAVLLNVLVGFLGPEGKPRMIMTAPLGVMLAPGLAMSIDSAKPVTLPFENCQAGGCRMVADLDQSSLDQFRRGDKMTVRFVTADRQAVDIPVPLKGFDAALKQLKK